MAAFRYRVETPYFSEIMKGRIRHVIVRDLGFKPLDRLLLDELGLAPHGDAVGMCLDATITYVHRGPHYLQEGMVVVAFVPNDLSALDLPFTTPRSVPIQPEVLQLPSSPEQPLIGASEHRSLQ